MSNFSKTPDMRKATYYEKLVEVLLPLSISD
jgi:hypothetical protein